MEHVAATAGVSKALLYQHFASKEELFAAVTEHVAEGFMGRLPEVLGTAGDALGAWRGVVALLCDLVTERPESWALVARHLDNPELGAPLCTLREQIYEVLAKVLASYYAPEQEAGAHEAGAQGMRHPPTRRCSRGHGCSSRCLSARYTG